MTEKRFKMVKSEFTGKYIPVDNNKFYNFCGFEDKWDCINFVRALNDFSKRAITNGKIASKYLEENEQLKQAYTQLEHRHSLLHDVCIDAECDRDSYRKDVVSLEKENEQLKSELKALRKKYNDFSDMIEQQLKELDKRWIE